MAVCCQNLLLGALSSHSAPSVLVGELFKKVRSTRGDSGNVIRELRAIRESMFQEAFQQWKKRWERCIASRGDYFEGGSA
jgi:hypothetical protein